MDVAYALGVIAAGGLAIGAMARLAVPGPDPMPIWLTMVIGGVGALVGGGIGYGAGGEYGAILGSLVVASVLLILYRRVVQKRGVTGPRAHLFPTRGPGVRRWRRSHGYPADNAVFEELVELELQEKRGEITPAEFERRRLEIVQKIRPGR